MLELAYPWVFLLLPLPLLVWWLAPPQRERVSALRVPFFEQIAAAAGIPNIAAPVTFDGMMISLGGALEIMRTIGDSVRVGVIVGAGFPFFFEEGGDVIRDISFPLDLWPEAALVLSIAPR